MSATEGVWYVVQTQIKVARNLLRQGFEIYLPHYLKRRSHARKVEKVAAPLFPRYTFVRMDLATQRWRSVQLIDGVSHVFLNGSDPAPAAGQEIHALKAREGASGYVTLEQRPRFAIGEVRELAGVFADNLGLFDGIADRDRVAILLESLGRRVRVSLEAAAA
jgi:transcriptional antiterminator RfaH